MSYKTNVPKKLRQMIIVNSPYPLRAPTDFEYSIGLRDLPRSLRRPPRTHCQRRQLRRAAFTYLPHRQGTPGTVIGEADLSVISGTEPADTAQGRQGSAACSSPWTRTHILAGR
ncbi:hypothetical protein A0H81_11487 [Grifola frondosa]|uniref:Uncharacterized protein n=1 Tax=Grifola frondosa TaxID=5627 RepID=A0A1C7LUX4_GRIFR|nr:hypothetical protein A0H81_11487 [Grifola frondosa]